MKYVSTPSIFDDDEVTELFERYNKIREELAEILTPEALARIDAAENDLANRLLGLNDDR